MTTDANNFSKHLQGLNSEQRQREAAQASKGLKDDAPASLRGPSEWVCRRRSPRLRQNLLRQIEQEKAPGVELARWSNLAPPAVRPSQNMKILPAHRACVGTMSQVGRVTPCAPVLMYVAHGAHVVTRPAVRFMESPTPNLVRIGPMNWSGVVVAQIGQPAQRSTGFMKNNKDRLNLVVG